ncbi:MAG TPA: hypothetical protein VES20_18825 [Bryobacteraceae bacterium]|nr:hypothetical protein [Bryobacteraceae bacterium]
MARRESATCRRGLRLCVYARQRHPVLFLAYNFGVHHAIALCQAEAFPIDVLTQALGEMGPFLANMGTDAGRRVETQNFNADLATLAICHQSVRLLIEQSRDSNVDHTVLDAFDRIFRRAVEAGHSLSDLSVINQFIRPSSGVAAADRQGRHPRSTTMVGGSRFASQAHRSEGNLDDGVPGPIGLRSGVRPARRLSALTSSKSE